MIKAIKVMSNEIRPAESHMNLIGSNFRAILSVSGRPLFLFRLRILSVTLILNHFIDKIQCEIPFCITYLVVLPDVDLEGKIFLLLSLEN